MKFDSSHKVKIETLNEVEAAAYNLFLEQERVRHLNTLNSCRLKTKLYDLPDEFNQALSKFWESEVLRQAEEIRKLDERVRKVKEL